MNMGEKIKTRRQDMGMSLREISDVVGVAPTTLKKWEDGDIASMRAIYVSRVASALGLRPGYLMGWEDDIKDAENAQQLPDSISASNNWLDILKDGPGITADFAFTATASEPFHHIDVGDTVLAIKSSERDFSSPLVILSGNTLKVHTLFDAGSGQIILGPVSDTVEYLGNKEIVGKVVGVIKKIK